MCFEKRRGFIVLLQADAAAILEVVKGDCGLDHHGQAVEPVRTEDWEESIRVR